MKLHNIEARDIPDCWFQLIDLCYKEGRDYKVGEGSYAGSQSRRQLDFVTMHIKYPQTRPLLPEVPPGLGIPNPVPEGMDYIERYLPYLLTADKQEGEDYTYGERLFGRLRTDMIIEEHRSGIGWGQTIGPAPTKTAVEECIAKLKRSFDTNQAVLSVSQPSDIFLEDPPCLRSISCRIFPEERKLHFHIYFRSWDAWGGVSANLAAIAYLQEYMAEEIGVECGEFNCFSDGLHLYDMYWELAKIRLGE